MQLQWRILETFPTFFLLDFPVFISCFQFYAYLCKAYTCRRLNYEGKQGWEHIHKRRYCTLWFWRPRTWKIQTIGQKQSNGNALQGVYIHRILNISCNRVLWETVQACRIYICHRGAFGIARFDWSGNSRALGREASVGWLHVFFLYMYVLFFIGKSVAVVAMVEF